MSNKTLTFFKFDDFYLDIDERCLTFQNQPVSLTPKAFQTLVVLLRKHGKVVEKEYFLNEVWADTFVEESILGAKYPDLTKNSQPLSEGQRIYRDGSASRLSVCRRCAGNSGDEMTKK